MILVNGGVEIKSRITTPDSEPLTIIALNGDLTVATSEPVQAGLVALNGKVQIPGSCHIRGILAAGEIGFGPPQSGLERQLEYHAAFDSTDSSSRDRMYRFDLADQERIYVH